jgi:hypothetical protein
MGNMGYVAVFATGYLNHLLVAIAWLVAAVLAVVNRRRHPKVSLLTFIAVSILFVDSLVSTFLSTTFPLMVDQRGGLLRESWTVLTAGFLVLSVFRAAAWIMLIIAIFGWRSQSEHS